MLITPASWSLVQWQSSISDNTKQTTEYPIETHYSTRRRNSHAALVIVTAAMATSGQAFSSTVPTGIRAR